MAIPAADLLARLDNLMNDDDRARWDVPERLRWINDAAREIVLRRPAARSVTQELTLVAGTLQTAPVGSAQVLDIIRNIIAGKPGRAIRITDRQLLDDAQPDWHTIKAGLTKHFTYDERTPTTFYVYPPANAGATVEALLSMPPPEVAEEDVLDMRAEFINAIVNWALYRCHTKDSEFSQGALAGQMYQAFMDAIATPDQAVRTNSPKGNSA
jgi:hypothetical protein